MRKINPLYLLVAALITVGFLVRTTGFLENNVLFLFDSARDFLWVNKLVVDHKPVLVGTPAGGLQGYFHGVIWYYMLAIPLFLTKGNPISGHWFMAILSSLSVFSAFYFLKKSMNMYAALLGLIIFSFSAFSIATAKFTWNSYPIVWLGPLFFYGMFLLSKKKPLGIIIIAFVQGLTLQFDLMIGLTTFPAFLLMLGYYLKIGKSEKFKYLLFVVLLIGVPFIPSLIFDLRHDFLISKSVLNTVVNGGNNLSHMEGERARPFVDRIVPRVLDLIHYSIQSITFYSIVNFGLFGLLVFSITKIF